MANDVQIVKEGNPQEAFKLQEWKTYTCKKCGCIFRRKKGDGDAVYGLSEPYDPVSDYVECPNCGKHIHILPLWNRILRITIYFIGTIVFAILMCLPFILSKINN